MRWLGTLGIVGAMLAVPGAYAEGGSAAGSPAAVVAQPTGADLPALTDRVLVRFRAEVPSTTQAALLRSAGATATVPPDSGNVQVLHAADPAATVVRLRARAEVEWAEREVRYRRLAEATATPERQETGFDTATAVSGRSMRGAGVSVAVIDDGVDPLNPDLSAPGKVLDGGDFTGEPGATGLTPSGDHGTGVAALIAAAEGNGVGIIGGAPDATIRSYRVFGAGEATSAGSAGVRAAILRAVQDGVAVINLSFGGPFRSVAVSEAIAAARAADVVVVVASGNDGSERPTFPAADHGVISVGASQQVSPGVWSVAGFSNGGSVDVLAPGDDITTWGGIGAGLAELQLRDGTSFASPQVAAIAAGLAASGVRGDRARAAITASAEPRHGGIPARSGAGRADAATSYTVATGTVPYDAVFVPGGHTVAKQVGRRTIEALRWDPLRGDADDGPPAVSATMGTVGLPTVSTRDIGPGRLHTVLTPYAAPTQGVDVASNAEVVAARSGDIAERLPLRLVEPTSGPEGMQVASGAAQAAQLVHGTTSSYIRSITLPTAPAVDVSFSAPASNRHTALLVWAPRADGSPASSHDVPVDGLSRAAGSGVLRFPSPAADRVRFPAGRYAVGFLLDPYDEAGARQLPRNADDGRYTLRVDTPAGVAVEGPAVQLVSDTGTSSSFPVRWGARSTGVVFDVEWTQRYRDPAGRWYIGAWRPWSGFTGTTRTSGTFGAEGGTVASPTKTYFIRVRGRDAAGNVSPWSAFRQYVVPVDDRYHYVSYAGSWRSSTAATAYLGTLRSTTGVATMRLAADTAGFTLIGERCPGCGQLRLRVDGGAWRTVDTHWATTLTRQQLHYTGSFGAIGRHTLEVQALATQGRPRVALDAIAIIR